MWIFSTQGKFWIAICFGLLISGATSLLVRSDFCSSRADQWAEQTGEQSNSEQGRSPYIGDVIIYTGTATPQAQKPEPNASRQPTGERFTPRPSPPWLCDAHFTDIAIAFFTYCLVIVGWAQMRSNEETVRNLERAQLMGGVAPNLINVAPDGKVTLQATVSNWGRSVAILKEFYGEFSDTEPKGDKAIYSAANGSAEYFDSGIPPTPITGLTSANVIPKRWESKFQGTQYFFGYVRFVDIFGDEFCSRYCTRVFPVEHRIEVAGSPVYNSDVRIGRYRRRY
jgi:hypothetical protein